MKKQLFFGFILAAFLLTPSALLAQSTEGTDFWVTFLRANGNGPDQHNLSLVFAAKQTANVHVENTYTGYKTDIVVEGGKTYPLEYLSKSDCYVGDNEEEVVSNNALHITSDKVISVIASNYGRKTFDVAAIMPTKALLSEYYIQSYSPSSHGNDDPSQGSHFAIVAAEDNVVVDFVTTVQTQKMRYGSITESVGDTITTPVLNKGQVYYVWTGEGDGNDYDLTGTWVKARDRKKIAVFNGNPHTNIPHKINSRDHVFSQAMPIEYWGKKFALTSSLTTIKETPEGSTWERLDKVRIIALQDSTVVKVNGDTLHVFSFEDGDADDKKHFFEFEFGQIDSKSGWQKDPLRPNIIRDTTDNCFIETSCPCAVHLFLTSNRYDHNKIKGVNEKYCNGDPSLIWINPIEQRIDTLTFGTFETNQVKDHFLNIVTLNEPNNLKSVKYDDDPIDVEWKQMEGNPDYVFARKKIIHGTHSLTADSGFIAHVYGFGDEESYGYPAGGNTKDLSATLYINDQPYSASSDNKLCGDKSVLFECRMEYKPDSLYWSFGDGTDTILVDADSVRHFYDVGDRGNVTFEAYVLIYHEIGLHDECIEWSNNTYDSIHFHVNVGMPRIDVKNIDIPRCIDLGTATDIKILLDNPAKVDLTGDSVKITFTQAALNAGFKNEEIRTQGDTMLIVHVPEGTPDRTKFNMHIHIGSECESTVFDKDIEFHMEYAIKLLEQRYKNVLGLIRDSFATKEVRDFVWFHNGDTVPNQQTSILYLDETNPQNSGEYYVCYIVKEEGKEELKECTCPITFEANGKSHSFTDQTTVGAYSIEGNKIFVNADWKGKTDIECYAQWYDVSGRTESAWKFNVPDGGCTIPTPDAKGFYILRVVTDGAARSFKIFINH
jgi:hypothetical protein